MSAEGMSPKPSRTPWIIAGVLGCLVVCLLIAVIGGGAYVFLNQAKPTPVVVTVPTVAPLTQPTVPPVVAPTQPPVVAQPTQPPTTQPTLPPTTPTQAPIAQSTATRSPAGPTGKIAFSKSEGDQPENQSIWIMNVDGSNAKKILDRASHPAFSPDGAKIVYYHWTDGLYIANADGTNPKKLVGDTFTGGDYGSPDWSHDGRWIAFSTQPGGHGNISIDAIQPDGTGRRNINVGEAPSWSPDDTQVTFHTCRGPCGIYKASSTASSSDAIAVITDDGGLPAWSPDGKKIVYQKEIDGQKQLFLIHPDGSGKKQLTTGAALHVDANWSSDGNFIFYRSPEGGTWAIWRMNADGTNPVKLIDNVVPVNWPYERLAVTR
jgi:Tol biopolymer transport system component